MSILGKALQELSLWSESMPKVEVVEIHKSYGKVVALRGVNLTINDGEYVCIIGPSGSGKSTLLKIIAGLLSPDRGDIYFDGERVTDLPPERRFVGLVMQDILLFPHMNVWENVIFSPLAKALPPSEIVRSGREIIDYLDLTLERRMFPDELSRGTQQKVALARALASEPKLLLLDEPLGSLDAHAARALRYELRRLVKDLGLTAIHITHNQEEALSIADRVVVLRKGRVEQVGTPLELYLSPRTPFVSRFIGGETNFLEGIIRAKRKDLALLELKGGSLLEAYTDLPEGTKVLVAIRPEHITPEPEQAGVNVLDGRVLERSFLGAYVRYVVETEEGNLIVRTTRNHRIREGDLVTLKINRAVVFKYPEEGLEAAIAYE